MCFSKQAIEIVPNLKEKQTEIEKIILQQSQNIGSLCLVDNQARKYSPKEKEMLVGIGNLVDNLINEPAAISH